MWADEFFAGLTLEAFADRLASDLHDNPKDAEYVAYAWFSRNPHALTQARELIARMGETVAS